MPKKPMEPSGDLTRALDALEFEEKVEKEFEEMPTLQSSQATKKCLHCMGDILLTEKGAFVKHTGPCGLSCLGGGDGVVLPFHSDHCTHPKCRPFVVPLPGIPKKNSGR